MAPNPQCAALAAAKEKKNVSYGEIAAQMGTSEQHIIDLCTAKSTPTEAEFNKLATILDIHSNVPHTGVHATKA